MKIKNAHAYNCIILFIVIVSLVLFFSVISDDDDISFMNASDNAEVLAYQEIIPNRTFEYAVAYDSGCQARYSQRFISFLARFEKSPPADFLS